MLRIFLQASDKLGAPTWRSPASAASGENSLFVLRLDHVVSIDNQIKTVTRLSAYGAKIRHTPIWRYAQSKNLKLYDSLQRTDRFRREICVEALC
jgi:hypothetical protein